MKKQFTIFATILLFFCASPASFAQSNIIGYSPPFLFNTMMGTTITAYSDLFVFNTQLESNRIVAYSNFFTFNTRTEEGRIIAYSDFFTFDTRGDEVGRIIAYSDIFTFDTRTDEVGRIVAYSDYFTFNTKTADSIVGFSDLFVFNTMPLEFLVSVDIAPETGGTVTGTGSYLAESEVRLEAVTNEGYDFLNWTDEDENEVSGEPVYTFVMPAEDVSLTANFQNVVGIGDLQDFELVVYPNPAQNKFFIESDRMIQRVVLFNAGGQVVRSVDMEALEAELDVSRLRTGIYFMHIHLPNNVVTRRVQIFR